MAAEYDCETTTNDEPTTDIAVVTKPTDLDAEYTVRTPQTCRVDEVSNALLPAYHRASTLDLTDSEINGLMEPFPDEAIEIRAHDGLIYIPHIEISNRLNKIIKPGKWALVRRREWFDKGVMYGEYVLLIRGCMVGESVGGHPYVASNPKTNYSDALESTAGEALRRIAAKRLSCGSQVWVPEFSRQWVARNAVKVNGKWERKKPTTQNGNQSAPTKSAPSQTEPAKIDYAAIWTKRLIDDPNIDQLNAMLPEIKALPDTVRKVIWGMVESHANGYGVMFDRELKKFLPPSDTNGNMPEF